MPASTPSRRRRSRPSATTGFNLKDFLRQPIAPFAAMLVVAIALGGGGAAMAFPNLAVQVVALGLLAAHPAAVVRYFQTAPRWQIVLLGLSSAIPLLQSIPLPAAAWSALPGRDLVLQSEALVGNAHGWFPYSVDAGRSLAAFASLIPVWAILILGSACPVEEDRTILYMLGLLGVACALIGTIQLSTGNWSFYPREADGTQFILRSTLANRNSTALFLDICAAALLLCGSRRETVAFMLGRYGLAGLLLIGVLLTRSRSGIALGLLAMMGTAAIQIISVRARKRPEDKADDTPGHKSSARKRPRLLELSVALAVLPVLLLGALLLSPNLAATAERFTGDQDDRTVIWKDALVSAKRFWPAGAGTGTFDEVFQVDETLETLNSHRAGRAHSDLFELAIESGIVGLALAAGWLVYLGTRVLAGWRATDRVVRIGACLAFALLLLQSLLDFPFRNESLLCVAATLLLLLGRRP